MIFFIVSSLTARVSGWKPVEYNNLTDAINDINNIKNFSYLKDSPKWGHIAGGGFTLFGAGVAWISSKLESNFFKAMGYFNAFTTIVLGVISLVIASVCKNQEEEETKKSIEYTVHKADPKNGFANPNFINSANLKNVLEKFITIGIPEQQILHLRGPFGTGKTHVCSLLANELVARGLAKNGAEFWDIGGDVVKPTDDDKWGHHSHSALMKFANKLTGGKPTSGETMAKRVERIYSQAISYTKRTGIKVVVCINEADRFIRGDYLADQHYDSSSGSTGGKNPAEAEHGRLLDDLKKLKGSEFAPIICYTSNLLVEDGFVQKSGRLTEFSLERPDRDTVKQIITLSLRQSGVDNQAISNLSPSLLNELADLSQAKLYDTLINQRVTKAELQIARIEKDTISPIFNYRHLIDKIQLAATDWKNNNSSKFLYSCLTEELSSLRARVLSEGLAEFKEEIDQKNRKKRDWFTVYFT